MEDVELTQQELRKRDRLKEGTRRLYDRVPLSVRTSDLPRRAMSALVMLAVAVVAFVIGGPVFRIFVYAVAAVTFAEFARLVLRATRRPVARLLGLLAGAAYIGLAAAVLAGLADFLVILVVGATVMVDTGAYFAGRTIGGPKIAPRISPSKTWAGLAGGMTAAGLWVIGWTLAIEKGADWMSPRFGLGLRLTADNLLLLFAIGAVLAVLAQVGDFLESWLKRKAGMKDSSNLIPGHGGFFDRVDGLMPVSLAVGAITALLIG